ncbi:MAG: hypothetical protein RLY20_880 [Verrucomicrobiota bacterium]|jgi:hypothetical protein
MTPIWDGRRWSLQKDGYTTRLYDSDEVVDMWCFMLMLGLLVGVLSGVGALTLLGSWAVWALVSLVSGGWALVVWLWL